MKIHLICFATLNFYHSQMVLCESALKFGVDETICYKYKDLKRSTFYRFNKKILKQKRGAGYWLWKPYIILETLKKIEAEDVLIYCDSGVEIIDKIAPIVELCIKQSGVMLFTNHNETLQRWTKRDCFILMNCDQEKFWFGNIACGTYQVYIKNERNIAFVEEWLNYCLDPRILTDLPNTCGYNNFENYIDHRHDQSILSILACKHNIELYRDPSQWGNFEKMERYRKEGEFIHYPYSDTPFINSPYNTIFNLHRKRKMSLLGYLKSKLIKLIY